MSVYPCKTTSLLKERIWGGRSLHRLYGKDLPGDGPIGESWELADLSAGECRIANGPRAGQSLRQLMIEQGPEVLGPTPALPDGRFPLLLKFLDAEQNLSVQVHPDAEAVKVIPDAALKTECWYILDSREGSIYKGIKPGVTAERMRAALADDNVADLLERYDVQAGDFHYLPAGTVHALGAGVVVAEVQTPSDTTYRVSDWGRGREVHVERAMQCIHFEPAGDDVPGAGGECLLETEYFHVFLRTAEPSVKELPAGRCTAWMILAGRGEVCSDDPDGCVEFAPGDTLLLPAGLTTPRVSVFEPAKWMEVTLPPFAASSTAP